MVDTADSKSAGSNTVRVQVSPGPPLSTVSFIILNFSTLSIYNHLTSPLTLANENIFKISHEQTKTELKLTDF